MKQITLILLCTLILFAGVLYASNENAEPRFSVMRSDQRQISLSLSTPQPMIQELIQVGKAVKDISVENTCSTADAGQPQLPIISTLIAIPPRGGVAFNFTYGSVESVPLQNPMLYEQEDQLIASGIFAGDDGIYPSQLVQVSEPAIIRDFRVVQINAYPYRYDHQNRQLLIYHDLQVDLSFNDEPGLNELPDYTTYSYSFRNIYEAQISNFAEYRELVVAPAQARILLIYGNNSDSIFMAKLNEFVAWKRQKGFDVNVVSTQVTGTSNTNIKNYIQNQYNNVSTRPDYIILLGDTTGSYAIPTWMENMSSYNGAGDYPYTHLAGNDLLGDVMIGRISAENLSQLATIFSKIYAYEKNINTAPDAAAWLNRILLIGDTYQSGISTIYNNKYIREMSKKVNPDYSYIENYTGGFSGTINSGINQGVSFFNYRGWINMSGWSPSNSLSNGPRLPHAVILTCSTGSFNYTSTSEDFIRLGTEAQPKGALTAIGMATSGTHTMFNNALCTGIFDGIFLYNMRTMGEALLNGRLYIWNIYGASHANQTNYFAHWCNLMGDPTVETFIGIPGNLNISAPASVPVGTSLVDITVTDDNGSPLENVSVTLYNDGYGNVVAKGFTDAQGVVTLNIPNFVNSQILVTASKHDYKPAQQHIEMDMQGALVYFDKFTADDGSSGSQGNSDSFINGGETIALNVMVKNTTAQTITGITSQLSTADPYITIVNGQSSYPSTAPESINTNTTPFLFTVAENIPSFHDFRLTLDLEDDLGTDYQVIFHLGAFNGNLSVADYSINAGGNNVLDPSENGVLNISVINSSVFGLQDIYGELKSLNDLVQVTDSLSWFGSFPAGMTVPSVDGFGLFARPQLIPGMTVPFRLRLFNASGFEQHAYFNIPIGTVAQDTPLGPDEYGYFIYDVSDVNYPDCPSYEWIEIVPSLGGSGTLITGLNDSGISGDEGDQVGSDVLEVVDLPFPFTFYGVQYNQITVCVNGFIAMGVTEDGEFRNGRMPGGQGPSPMIAPFWDDLIITGGGGIYRYYDSSNHLFIIQYQNLKNGYNRTSEETFQVIFYDPVYHPTSMDDGKIKIQYKVFNNVDVGSSGGYTPRHGNYATVGIRDHTNKRGLEYTYNNQYPLAAQPLGHNKALLITTVPMLYQTPHLVVGELIVNDANADNVLEPGESANLGLKLNNLGMDTATSVTVTASTLSPYITISNPSSSYPDICGSGSAVNIEPIAVTLSPDCPDGISIPIQFYVEIEGNSWTYQQSVQVFRAQLSMASVFINDVQGNCNGLAEPGETFKMVVNYENTSDVAIYNLTSNIMSLSEDVFIANPQQLINQIPARSTSQVVYNVSLTSNVIVGNNITFYLTYLGDQIPAHNEQLLLSVGTTGMMNDFESSDGGFMPSPTNNTWQWGEDNIAGSHSGSKVWGTVINAQYSNNANWTLSSPDVFIGANFILEFWHWFNMENNYDGGNVKISTNNGGTWTLLTPLEGYTHSNVSVLNGPGFSGVSQGWVQSRYDLGAYQNQNVKFRWTFASDSSVQARGWYIDDVQTTGYFPFAGEISGVVASPNSELDLSLVKIKNADGFTTQPDNSGQYALYLPTGLHSVEASAPGYKAETVYPVDLSVTSPVLNQNFDLDWLAPAVSHGWSVLRDTLRITWNAPQETQYPINGYEVYRRLNSGRYELMEMCTGTEYVEALAILGSYSYYIVTVYSVGTSLPTGPIEFSFPITEGEDPETPALVTRLLQNYPNPFNPSTTISFDLAKNSHVKLSVYNLRGQLVKTLASGELAAGHHHLIWNGTDSRNRTVASGVYLFRLEAGNYISTRKMMLIK